MRSRSPDANAALLQPERMRSILGDYVPDVPPGLEMNIIKYMKLLELWGRRMPLTSLRDPEEIVRFHFGESIFACTLFNGGLNGRLADVGSGAGFPGLAIKLFKRSISAALIESNKKKCAFLHEVVRSLDLKDVAVLPSRFELAAIPAASVDFITCRALAEHDAILEWARTKLAPGGSVLLWLAMEGCAGVSSSPGWRWDRPALIPGTRGRFILRGVPV